MKKIILILLVGLLLAGCGAKPTPSEVPVDTTAAPPAQASASPTGLETLVPAATDTPTPLPARVVLLVPAGADESLAGELEAGLSAPLEQAGLQLERLVSLEAAALGADLHLVVALPPDTGLAVLAAAAPQVQFLAVGVPGLPQADNLSVIGPDGPRPGQEGFIAGVVAAMTTFDWRVGVLSTADTPEGIAFRQGFLTGAVYFCGLCNPTYGPIIDYPVYAEAAASASAADWQAAVQALVDSAVETVYVSPLVTDAAAWEALAQTGMALITGTALPAELSQRGVVQVRSDPLPAVLELLPRLLAGEGGIVEPLPVRLVGADEQRFSPGRQARVDEILADLLAGYIDPK